MATPQLGYNYTTGKTPEEVISKQALKIFRKLRNTVRFYVSSLADRNIGMSSLFTKTTLEMETC